MAAERGIYEDPGEIDPRLWDELAAREVAEVRERAWVEYDGARAAYVVPFLEKRYLVHPAARTIRAATADDPAAASFQFHLVVLTYLLRCRPVAPSGRMVTASDLRGGALFFRGPHVLFARPLEERYGGDPAAFLQAGGLVGGTPTGFGDASFRLWPLPRIPLGYILWGRDDEFEARLVITFDATIEEHLPLDVIWALVNVVGARLLAAVPVDQS